MLVLRAMLELNLVKSQYCPWIFLSVGVSKMLSVANEQVTVCVSGWRRAGVAAAKPVQDGLW